MIEIPNIRSVRHLAHFIRAGLFAVGPDRGKLGLATAFAFASGVFQTILLFILASIAVILSGKITSRIIWIGKYPFEFSAGMLVLFAVITVLIVLALTPPLANLQASLISRAIARTRGKFLRAYLTSTYVYREKQPEGYFQKMIIGHCQHVDGIVQQFSSFCVAFTTLVALLLGGFIVSPKLSVILIVAVAAGIAFVGPLAHRIRQQSAIKSAANRDVFTQSAQLSRLTEEITVFDVGEAAATEVSNSISHAADVLYWSWYRDALVPPLYQYGTLTVILAFVGGLVVFDPGRHPSFAPLALLLVRVLSYGRQTLSSIQNGTKAVPYVEELRAEIQSLEEHSMPRNGVARVRFTGISFDKVSFSFEPEHELLHALSFNIRSGETVGFIGPSGGGKSTLCRLMLKLHSPTSGVIAIGDLDLHSVMQDAWAETAAYVSQESKLIYGSVSDNIRFYRSSYDFSQVEKAARDAHIHDEIMALPEAYDTMVGPGTRGMSVGQRQRIGIARALIGKPQFMILDEPTSALDQKSELSIRQTLEELKGHTTIVIIAHRPAILDVCDHIFRLEDGRLTEVGSAPDALRR